MEINQEVEIAKIEATKEIVEKTGSTVKNAVKTLYSDSKSSDSFAIFMAIVGIGVVASFINHYNNLHKNNEVIINV